MATAIVVNGMCCTLFVLLVESVHIKEIFCCFISAVHCYVSWVVWLLVFDLKSVSGLIYCTLLSFKIFFASLNYLSHDHLICVDLSISLCYRMSRVISHQVHHISHQFILCFKSTRALVLFPWCIRFIYFSLSFLSSFLFCLICCFPVWSYLQVTLFPHIFFFYITSMALVKVSVQVLLLSAIS